MPQLDMARLNGFTRDAAGNLVKQKVIKPPQIDPSGNVTEQEAWEYQQGIASFDINCPPTLPLPYREYPKLLYRSGFNLAVSAETMKVSDKYSEEQALAAGWQHKPHVLQPLCDGTFEDENQLIHCEMHVNHSGKHRNGDFLWKDNAFDAPLPSTVAQEKETKEAVINRHRAKRYADGTLSPDAASMGITHE